MAFSIVNNIIVIAFIFNIINIDVKDKGNNISNNLIICRYPFLIINDNRRITAR